MRALSLWQPHAQAIALGLKPWETRDWSTRYRGPLAIHAAKHPWTESDGWHADARRKLKRAMEASGCFGMAYGAIVCVAELVDCVPTRELRGVIPSEAEFWGDFSDGDDDKGRYAFKLENVRRIWPALKVKGRQRWFEVAIPGSNDAFKRTLVAPREPSQRSLEESCTDEQLEGISLK